MSTPINFIKTGNELRVIKEILNSSVSILLGVSPQAVDFLKTIGVNNIFDLAYSRIFAIASDITTAAADPQALFSRHGSFPAQYIDEDVVSTPLTEMPKLLIAKLSGLTDDQATAINSILSLTTIRDFALWPPYQNARILLDLAYHLNDRADGENTFELVPKLGEFATEIAYYSKVVMIERPNGGILKALNEPVDITQEPPAPKSIGIGALLRFCQTWTPRAITLGKILYSLPLAAGESTKIAVIDWTRRTRTSSEEDISQTENLSNAMQQNQNVSEIASVVASELQTGYSSSASMSATASAAAAGAAWSPAAAGAAGTSASATGSASTSVSGSKGIKDVTSEYGQEINNATEQVSLSQRAKKAALVTEATQEEREQISTRTVTNYNHMHALNVLYFEVVQLYRVSLKVSKAERLIFIPMKTLSFDNDEVCYRYRYILAAAALHPNIRFQLLLMSTSVNVTILLPRPDRYWFIRDAESEDHPILTKQESIQRAKDSAKAISKVKNAFVETKTLNPDTIANLSQDTSTWEMAGEVLLVNVGWNPDPGRITRVVVKVEDGPTYALTANAGINNSNPAVNPALTAGPIKTSLLNKISIEFSTFSTAQVQPMKLYFQTEAGTKFGINCDCVLVRDHENADLVGFSSNASYDNLKAHLKANALYYSQNIWRNLDPQTLGSVLSQYSVNDKPLLEYIDTTPLSVNGNYVIFRWNDEDDEKWQEWKADRINDDFVDERLVSLPTGGVFAEAVLGRSNSAEKLDITRFWNWQDSPIPFQAPDIAAIQAGQHTVEGAQLPGNLAQPVLNIVNPSPLLQSQGLAGLLGTMLQPGLFRDMSGLEGTQALTQAGMQISAQSANSALSTIAGLAGTAGLLGAGIPSSTAVSGTKSSSIDDRSVIGNPVQRGMEKLLSPLTNSHTAAAGAINLGRTLQQENVSTTGVTKSGSQLGASEAFDRLLPSGTSGQQSDIIQVATALELGKTVLPENIDQWREVFLHRLSGDIIHTLEARRLEVQDFFFSDNPVQLFSSAINLDLYEVRVTRMPIKVDGSTYSKEELFKEIRLGMSDLFDIENLKQNPFAPFLLRHWTGKPFEILTRLLTSTTLKTFNEDIDKPKWESDDPMGAVLQFDTPADDMGVVVSKYSSDYWIFSTVGDSRWPFVGDVGTHPVSGNRKFGIREEPPNSLIIYTKAADRASGIIETGPVEFAFLLGNIVWLTWQAGLVSLIEKAGGSAEIIEPVSERYNFARVSEHFRTI